MDFPVVRHFAHQLNTKGSAPNLSTAAYFDAFSSIDRSIRSLNNGKAHPHLALEIDTSSLRQSQYGHGLDSPVSAATLPVQQTPSEHRTSKGASRPPPSLDFVGRDNGGGMGACDDADDEDAVVTFLCSGLPHYEGPMPIHYDDLDLSLSTYLENQQWGDLDDEEYVSDSAWDTEGQPTLCGHPSQLPSPQTPSMPCTVAEMSTYEGWIDVGELLAAARDAVDPWAGLQFYISRRAETDHMLLYYMETVQAGGPACVAQIPKLTVSQQVFESEILSLAYINEQTSLPVQAVLAYDFSTTNPVGVPFAILDKRPGEPLAEHWPRLEPRQKRKILDQVAETVVHLSRLQFPRIGSLAIADGRLEIGPLLHARQFEDGYVQLDRFGGQGQGPFTTTRAYYDAMIRASLDAARALEQEGAADCHLSYRSAGPSLNRMELEAYAACIDHFVTKDLHGSGPFVLMPESLDAHHFLIDPRTCQLTGVVDWTFCGTRPLATLVQPPPFTFDDTPRWEPTRRDARLAHRRNLVRYRQWFKAGLQKKAWALLGKDSSDEMAKMVRFGYWRYKFENEICENIQYTNPWTFRAIWEHAYPNDDFTVWFAAVRASNL